ncbi:MULTISPECIES: DUF1273 domain-containing protein [Bacillus]|uniref:DUF1273 domain-containing protein n=1 Tax=Bacillus TaxID=1386 RepID=UPI00040C9334|nr:MULTISPECIES: DUF1273 domain-containing protein [Bacillus]QHZ47378.1 DUF1273 domain-containing protein [Bacillus sp. NSP9.1]WFA03437.1 DUF1273 domain-containing protein [Bacillus sp. HSf4]
MKVLAVTGYKPFEIGVFKQDDQALFYIKKAIENRMLALLDEGLEWILISGQLGAEIWTAQVAFSLQEEYPELKVAVITPFLEQEKNWNEKNKELYEDVLAQSDYTESLTHRPYESPVQFRQKNRFFIEKSDGLLILYDEEVEGSPVYMLNEAKKAQEKRDYPIYTITMDDLRVTVEEHSFSEE